jgi:hypothetical protein
MECLERGWERGLEVDESVSFILPEEKVRDMQRLEQEEVLEGWPMDTTDSLNDIGGEDVQPKFFEAVCR